MRISVPVSAFAVSKVKFIVVAMTTLLLAGCSSSIERFAADYNNPSDTDPVYTASVPKYKSPAPRKISQKYIAPREEIIVQSPIAAAPFSKPNAQTYDYSKAYKNVHQPKLAYNNVPASRYRAPTYKQPNFSAPREETIAQSTPEPSVNAPVYKKVASLGPTVPLSKQNTLAAPKFTYKQAPMLTAPTQAGNTLTVGAGMTLYGIARANHMSVQQLAEANHLKTPYAVSQGQVLRIPGAHVANMPETSEPVAKVKTVSLGEEKQVSASTLKPFKTGGTVTVASGDTLYSIGRKYGVAPFAIADLNGLKPNKPLTLGQSLKIPAGAKTVVAQDVSTDDNTVSGTPDKTTAVADAPVKKPAALALPKNQPQEQVTLAEPAPDTNAALALRWPLKGKVISGFGAKPNGLKNEGINIAVPEGTNIQAAEGGVVAYAGNELKGYGNLVLVRHAGGYVTAYAHASQLLVKRGDTVKRGDVIAKAGQTGAVQSPQLHFEVRKGATALDPNKFLTSSTASN